MDKKYYLSNFIIVLIIVPVGLILMWKGNSFLNNVGTVLLVSGIYTILDNMFLKKSLVDLVLQKVNLQKDIVNTGLVKVGFVINNINYPEYFENAKSEIVIVHNYAQTWTNSYFDFIKKTITSKNCCLRVVLLNPKSAFVPALEKHYNYPQGELSKIIVNITNKWKELYDETERLRKEGHTCGNVELYYFNGQPTNSIYRIDDNIIVVNAKNSKSRSSYLPYMIYKNNGETGLFHVYLKEIEAILDEADKIDFKEGSVCK